MSMSYLQTFYLFIAVFLASCNFSASIKKTGQVDTSLKRPDERKLVWSDEFNYTGLPNPKKWAYEMGYVRNKELQYYTVERPENARVENGLLIIEARNDSLEQDGKRHPVTSASLVTKGLAEWTYGRIEINAKIPATLGTWPAIWMLGASDLKWPDCGEIDIMENVGFDPDIIHTNIHTKAYNHVLKTNRGTSTQLVKPYFRFHSYIIDWTDKKIDFLIDDNLVFTYKNDGAGNASWPFDKPFYLILNLAFGGAWGGQQGVDVHRLPQQFLVEYVRVYQ